MRHATLIDIINEYSVHAHVRNWLVVIPHNVPTYNMPTAPAEARRVKLQLCSINITAPQHIVARQLHLLVIGQLELVQGTTHRFGQPCFIYSYAPASELFQLDSFRADLLF